MYTCNVNTELKYLVRLKEIKASLQKEIYELDSTISGILMKNVSALKFIANQETIGVYDYKLCKGDDAKVKFALERLGKSNFNTLHKFLEILGEEKTGSELFVLIENGLQDLHKQKILKQLMINDEAVYFIFKNFRVKDKLR